MNKKQEDALGKALTPILFTFRLFGTRRGYTKLLMLCVSLCLVDIVIYAVQGLLWLSLIPSALAMGALYILDLSYKNDKQIVDAFTLFTLLLLWVFNVVVHVFSYPLLVSLILLWCSGIVFGIIVTWTLITGSFSTGRLSEFLDED